MADFNARDLSYGSVEYTGAASVPFLARSYVESLVSPAPGATTYYKMRAEADPGPGYVTWIVAAMPDFNGAFAPAAIQVGTAVVTGSWLDSSALLSLLSEQGLIVWSNGNPPTPTPAVDYVTLGVDGNQLLAIDHTSALTCLNRTRPRLSSSGVVTLTFDIHDVLSSTATASALPDCTADDVGRCVAVTNRTAGTLTISRAGADLIDGATTFALAAGSKVVFEVVAANDWAVWG